MPNQYLQRWEDLTCRLIEASQLSRAEVLGVIGRLQLKVPHESLQDLVEQFTCRLLTGETIEQAFKELEKCQVN